MGLSDYTKEMRLDKINLYATICVYQGPDHDSQSHINDKIEELIENLKAEMNDFKNIFIAYVYETKTLMNCTGFSKLDQSTTPLYTEQVSNIQNLDHLFFMGQAVLEQRNKLEYGECRLYLLTDEKFKRKTNIVWEEGNELVANPRFENLYTKMILIKAKDDAGGDLLEQYMHRNSF